jgi:hypothetical protein
MKNERMKIAKDAQKKIVEGPWRNITDSNECPDQWIL